MKKVLLLFGLAFPFLLKAQQDQIDYTSANDGATFSTCAGFIIDSGGQGGPGYSDNEDITITFCPPDPANDEIFIQFNLFNLDAVGGSADSMFVYDGDNTGAPLIGSYVDNELEGIVLAASATNPTGCITIRFVSDASGGGRFTAAVTCVAPCTPPIVDAIVSGIAGDSIPACLDVPLDFLNNGSYSPSGFNIVSYEWDFQDGSAPVAQENATHTFTEPGYYTPRLVVVDENGCESMNSTGLRVYVAPRPSFEGFPTDTTICLGQSISIEATPETYGNTWNGFPNSSTIADGCVDDEQYGIAQVHTLELGGYIPGATLTDISDLQSVCIEIEHSFIGDFVLQVQCATGQTVTLHQQGGGGANLGEPVEEDNVDCDDPSTIGVGYNYCFTPTATQTWVDAAAVSGGTIPAGDYAAVGDLSDLIGCPLNDVWTIIFTDNWAADDGVIFGFSINVNPALLAENITIDVVVPEHQDSSYWTSSYPWGSISDNNNLFQGTPDQVGQYTLNYEVIDNFGCINDTSLVVNVEEPPVVQALDDILVCNTTGTDVVQLGATVTANGFSNLVYEWTSPDNLDNPNIINPNATVTGEETFTITVYPQGAPQCYSDDQMTVTVAIPENFGFDSDFFVCPGDEEFLFAADSLALESFEWISGGSVIGTNFSNYLPAGEYQTSLVDSSGCTNDTLFTIDTQDKIILNDFSLVCDDTLFMFGNQGVTTGVWSVLDDLDVTFIDENDLNTNAVYEGMGTVGFVYSEDVCNDSDTTYVDFNRYPWTEARDSVLCRGSVYYVEALHLEQNETYYWDNGYEAQATNIDEPGEYTVTVSNSCGSYSHTILVDFILCDLEVPNVFTPNGDDLNDFFQLKEYDGLENFEIAILNRWGNVIRVYTSPDFKWDGTNEAGEELGEGVYFYNVKTETWNGEILEKHGFVQLIRE